MARFEREAKTLASPNHPHIAAIYAVEKSASMLALVMELVEGEDLSQRIARSAIPLHVATSHSEWSVAPVSCSTSAATGVDFVHVDQ